MQIKDMILSDASGGLNNRDHPSRIDIKELAELENWLTDEGGWPGKKRLGKELIQYAPIDPQVFVADGSTVALYHLDEAGSTDTAVDDTGNYSLDNFSGVAAQNATPSTTGLFPIGAGLARAGVQAATADSGSPFNGSLLWHKVSSVLNALSALTIECWVKIPSTFSGQPTVYTRNATPLTISNSGAHLFGTTGSFPGSLTRPGGTFNGFSIYRDWDAAAGKDASAPYVIFTLHTHGVANTVTTLQSLYLPTDAWIHLRGTYDSSTGYMALYANGSLNASAYVNGAGTVFDFSTFISAFGSGAAHVPASIDVVNRVAPVALDDMQISSTVRATFPFKTPRGKPWELTKSDGTRQLIVAAGDGLYYTVGDGNWVKMNDGTHDVLGAESFSTTADWEAFQLGDVLYLTNGVDPLKSWDGTSLRPWGEGVKTLTLTSTNVGGGSGIGSGNHSYYYTFMFGQYETGPSVATTINLASDAFAVNVAGIPTGTQYCSARRLYRKKQGDSNLYLIRTIADNTTTAISGTFTAGTPAGPTTDTGRDGVLETSLGSGNYVQMLASVFFTAIKKARYLLGAHNRMFATGILNSPYSLYWSEDGAPEVFLVVSFVNATQDRGVLLGMANYYGEIHLSKGGHATLVLRGDKPSNWTSLEILHPTIGAIDHWSFVHRTLPGRDSYVLCFWARDGAYAYSGQDFYKISDKIRGTVDGLVQGNSSKLDAIYTTQADFEAAYTAGGTATANIHTASYETDGTREVPGQVRIVDQLNYLGLWRTASALVGGHVTALCKGPAEGEFLFATDADENLYRTTNNFVTVSTVASVTSGHRIVEITYALISAADNYWVFEMNPSTQGGGVYRYNSGAGLVLSSAGPYFWQGDAPSSVNSSAFGDLYSGNASGINPLARTAGIGFELMQEHHQNGDGSFTDIFGQINNAPNLFINHAQNIVLTPNVPTDKHRFGIWSETTRVSNSLNGFYAKTLTNGSISDETYQGPTLVGQNGSLVTDATTTFAVLPGNFYGMANWTPTNDHVLRNPTFVAAFTWREGALAAGGTFRPQSFWNATQSKLFFVGSSAEDANGNRTSHVYSLTAANTLVSITAAISCIALTNDGTNAWFSIQNPGNGTGGFVTVLKKFALSGTTVTTVGSTAKNYLVLRLSWNTSTSRLVATGRYFGSGAGFDGWTFNGFIGNLNTTTAAMTALKSFVTNGNSGAYPVEIAYQTVTPFSQFSTVQAMGALDPAPVYTVAAASAVAGDVTVYKSDVRGASTGSLSNLLFVPSSGAAGGNLWADRLYFNPNALNEVLVQLGVPGSWTVLGSYESSQTNVGAFDAFGPFQVDYSGLIAFFMRNATAGAISSAAYQSITPNAQLLGFTPGSSPPATDFQWKANFSWAYTVAAPTTSPFIDFVDIVYFLGSPTIPRIVGFHYKNRTYWAVARIGQAANDLVVVYQKNDSWTTYTGWRLKGMNEFRNDMVALEDYQLVKLESSAMDMGNLIRSHAKSGNIMDQTTDKCIRNLYVNELSYVNKDFPTKDGWMKLQAFGGESALAAEWFFPILPTGVAEPRQVAGVFEGSFPFAYARAFAVSIGTSDDTGNFQPAVNQPENIASVLLQLFISNPRSREVNA